MPIKTETSDKVSKTKARNAAIAAKSAALPKISKQILDELVPGPMSPAEFNNLSMALKKALVERVLGAELTHHLGYAPGAERPDDAGNHRNGASAKTVHTDDGPLRIEVPRDRAGSFEPLLIGKHERRFTGFDDKIIALYARGMTMREIQGFLAEQYGCEVSAEFISAVTGAVMAEVTAWQSRPLEPMYPVVFFDALRVKIREDAVVRNKAIYLALGVLPDGTREILGLWIEGTEGAKFWMKVFNDLKTRGVADILIAVTDGLKGMPEALGSVFPATTLQTCIVHLIRNSLDYASWKERKALAAAIKPIYTAPSAEAAQAELDAFAQGAWGAKFATVVAAWRRAWEMQLVHMNGRVYDPLLGKFLSVDPVVGNPNDLQTYNRYSYVYNQPTRYADATGNCPWCAIAFIVGVAMADMGNKYWSVVGKILMVVAAPQMLAEAGLGTATVGSAAKDFAVSYAANAGTYAASAALAEAASPGASVESVATAAIFAVAFNAAGNTFAGKSPQLLAAHAFLGCAQSAMSGGKCGPGAMAAFIGKGTTVGLDAAGVSNPVAIGVATTIAGGTASVIGGGKFGNGAFQAGFAYVFNYLAHVHKDLTYRASRMAGLNPLASDLLSGATVMVDFQGPSLGGSMGIEFASQDVEHSHMHAMCAGGSSAALCDLKIADYREKLWNVKSMAGLAGLLHLYQDSFAPGHANLHPYNGSVDWQHIQGDRSPPPALANQIVRGSAAIIKNYLNNCQCGR